METSKGTPLTTGLLFGTSAFGMGMLTLPSTFNQLGIILTLMIMLSLAALLYASLYFINAVDESEKATGNHDYSYFSNKISPKLKIIVSIAFICSNFCVVYLFLRRATDLTVALVNMGLKLENTTWIRLVFLSFYAVMSTFLFLQKDLSVLKPLSYVSLGAAIYFMVLMFIMGVTTKNKFSSLKLFNFDNGVSACLNIIFAAHCQFSFLDFKRILKEQNKKTGNKLALVGTLMIYGIYIPVGFFGYMYLGTNVGTDYILKHFLDNANDNLLFEMNNV